MKRGTGDDPLAFLANRKKRTRPSIFSSSSSSHSRRHEGSSHSSSRGSSASHHHQHRRSSRDPLERGGGTIREGGHDGGRSSQPTPPPPSSSSLSQTSNPTPDSDLFSSLVGGASLSQSSTHHRHHHHNSRHSRSSSLARSGSFGLERRRRRPSEEGETPSSLSSQTSRRGGGEGRGVPSSSTPSSQRGFPSSLGNAGATPHRQTPTITSFSRSSSLSRGDIPISQDRDEEGYTEDGGRRSSTQGGNSSSQHHHRRRGEVEGSQGIGGGVDVRTLLEEARAPERSMDECFPVLVDLPVRGAAHLCNLGFHFLADEQLQRHLEFVLESELDQSQQTPPAVTNGIHQASFDRLRNLLLLLSSYPPRGGGASTSFSDISSTTSSSPHHSGFLVLPKNGRGGRESQTSVFVGHQELRGATLVRKETARGLVERLIGDGVLAEGRGYATGTGPDVEVWPLRSSIQFLSKNHGAYGSALDCLLMFRASSLSIIPCQLLMPLPPVDLHAVEGFMLEEAPTGCLLLLPAWCAQVLHRRRLADVYLPSFLTAEELKSTIAREEKMKDELAELPECFFEISNFILFNPLLQPRGVQSICQQERDDGGGDALSFPSGLVLQIWDRRQKKIADIISRHRATDERITLTNIQPSETFLLSHVFCDTEYESVRS
ncbi:gins complex protein [Cystoisospora suis]|uniref:Gins complex protein n=1 Tax=Cystoisospora suis TaxID=483139 RepID=A0A2C6LAW1_9APIC|nr:gins complex protein [Cystoisospora suis]